jgi:hypothetical protein
LNRLQFLATLTTILENSPEIERLEVLSYDGTIGRGLQDLGLLIVKRNWNVSYLHHVKRRPIRGGYQ